jgi:hypothetical protein
MFPKWVARPLVVARAFRISCGMRRRFSFGASALCVRSACDRQELMSLSVPMPPDSRAYTIQEATDLFTRWKREGLQISVSTSSAYRPRRRPRGTPKDYKSFKMTFTGVVAEMSATNLSITGIRGCELKLGLDLRWASIVRTEFPHESRLRSLVLVSFPGGESFVIGELARNHRVDPSPVVD